MHWPRIRGLCSVSWCLAEGQWNGDQRRPMGRKAREGLYSFTLTYLLTYLLPRVAASHAGCGGEADTVVSERLPVVERDRHARMVKSQLHATRHGTASIASLRLPFIDTAPIYHTNTIELATFSNRYTELETQTL